MMHTLCPPSQNKAIIIIIIIIIIRYITGPCGWWCTHRPLTLWLWPWSFAKTWPWLGLSIIVRIGPRPSTCYVSGKWPRPQRPQGQGPVGRLHHLHHWFSALWLGYLSSGRRPLWLRSLGPFLLWWEGPKWPHSRPQASHSGRACAQAQCRLYHRPLWPRSLGLGLGPSHYYKNSEKGQGQVTAATLPTGACGCTHSHSPV